MAGGSAVVIGCAQVDIVITPLTDLPPSGETIFVDELSTRVGGAGANSALAFAEIGVPVRLIGAVGDDHFGRWISRELADSGLAGDLTVIPSVPTGVTVACEGPARDRSFVTYLGVNEIWSRSMIPDDVVETDNLLLCDYCCMPALQDSAKEILMTARNAGARTFYDTAWDAAGWPEEMRRKVLDVLPAVDVFLPNEAEALAIAGGDCEAREAAHRLQEASGGWVVVKLGPRGCLAVSPKGEELSAPAPAVRLVDSTGAGDAFNAGLASALDDGKAWPEALQAATLLASTIVARPSANRYRPNGRGSAPPVRSAAAINDPLVEEAGQ